MTKAKLHANAFQFKQEPEEEGLREYSGNHHRRCGIRNGARGGTSAAVTIATSRRCAASIVTQGLFIALGYSGTSGAGLSHRSRGKQISRAGFATCESLMRQ